MTDFEMLPPEEPIWRPMKRAWVVKHPKKSYYLGEKAVVDDIRNAYLFTTDALCKDRRITLHQYESLELAMALIALFANANDARNASRCRQAIAIEGGFVGCNGVLLNGKTVIIDAKGGEFVVDANGVEHISDALRKARQL